MVSGKPATRAAARNSVAPDPGARTLPTAMSSTRLGSMRERERREERVCARRSGAAVLSGKYKSAGVEKTSLGISLLEAALPAAGYGGSQSAGDDDIIGRFP